MNAPFRSLPVFVLVGSIGAAAAAPAQETPATPPPPPADGGLSLAFKHKAGQIQKFKGTIKVDAAISPGGGASAIGSIPVISKSVLAFTEKVTGTRKGTGTLSLALTSLVSNTDAFGTKVVNRFQNGKVSTSVNGAPAGQSQAAAAAELAELKKPAGFRRDPQGLTTPIGSGNNAFGQLFGSTSFTIVQLPSTPVKVGDSWETVQKIRPTVVTGKVPFLIPEIEFRYTHTLKRLDTRNGRQQALIESSGSGAPVGQEADTTVNQSITGTTRFDIARGAVVSSQYNILLGMSIPLPPGAVPAGADAPNGVRIDGTIDVVVAEVPAAVAAKKAKR